MPERDRPEPPTDLDRDAQAALSRLEDRDPDRLRAVGRYLEELAAWRESTEDDESADGDGDGDEVTETTEPIEATADGADADHEYPEDVPERAEVTVKEIAGTTYYYYQWRDGDRIESKTVQR